MSPSEIVFQFLHLAQSPIISVGLGTSFAFKRALSSSTSRVLNTSSLLPRRTIAQSCSTRTPSTRKDIVCTPLYVPAPNDSEWALEGLVARARFRRPVEDGFSHFTITSVYINHKCAGRRFICTNLLLLTCNLCVKERARPPHG